jgi:hypothetical protein
MRSRSLYAALLLAATASRCLASAETGLTFDTPAERVSVLLQELGPKLGLNLKATKSVQDDVIVLRLRNVPATEVLARIAFVLHASWRSSDHVRYLTRTDKQDSEQVKSETEADVAAIRDSQQKQAAALASLPPFDQSAAQKLADELAAFLRTLKPVGGPSLRTGFELDQRGPLGRGLAQIKLMIPAEELAEIPLGIRVMYSTQPTKLQRQLPDEAVKVAQQVLEEQAIWAQTMAKRNIQAPRNTWTNALFQNQKPLAEVPTRALLCVSRFSKKSALSYQLFLATDLGHVVAQISDGLNIVWAPKPESVPAATDAPLELPASVQAVVSGMVRGYGANSHINPELKARLLDPEKNDPMSLVVGPSLVAVAEAKNENLVALIDDQWWDLGLRLYSKQHAMANAWLDQVRSVGDVTEGDGWLTVRPLQPAFDRGLQLDRTKFARYLALRVSGKRFDLEDQADWALALPRAYENDIPRSYIQMLLPPRLEAQMSEDLLRFYGGMSPAQREAATSSTGIPISVLTEDSVAELNRMVFGFGAGIRRQMPLASSRPQDFLWISGLGREPTQIFGDGLPKDARLKITETTGPVVVSPGQGSEPTRYFSASDIASFLVNSEGSGAFPPSKRDADILQNLGYGQQRQLSFDIDFGNTVHLGPLLLSEVERTTSPMGKYTDLPADFRSQVETIATARRHRQ